jgi:hypothetical protein
MPFSRSISAALPRVLGLLLLTAACLKATDVLMGRHGHPLLLPFPLLFGLIGLETILALWLLSGMAADWGRIVSLVCFAVFFGAAAAHALTGESTCGCMGRLPVPPWLAALVDLAAIGLLYRWRPRGSSTPHSCEGRPLFLFGHLVFAVVAGGG